ncbi:MAG: prenyltransferase/squalene oxidase repeat-containing protein, partial [Chloroflexota bacterium]
SRDIALGGAVSPARLNGAAPGPTARAALDRALQCLLDGQRARRYWVGVLSSSALASAIAIVALQLSDSERHADVIGRGRRRLLETQAADGGWGDAEVDPSNINATALAIGALTFTAPNSPEAGASRALARAHDCLDRFGGFDAVGDPRRCTLSGPARTVAALAGLMDWHRIKRLRPEIVLLPARLRRTISTTFPAYLSIAGVHARMAPHPLNLLPTYRYARRRVVDWLQRTQGPDGSFEASAFLTSVIIACMVLGDHGALPWLPAAVRFVVESQREDGGWPIDRDLETFDTAMSVQALSEAGIAVPHADQVRDWLLARQFQEPCFPTGARPGGWAWAMPAGWPECDDTSYALLALLALGVPASAGPIRRGARWLERMQNADGSWSTFVRNSRMPFDRDCPYITGHVLSALSAAGRLNRDSAVLGRALDYLARAQRHDGSFGSIWFREATAGTASVLEALADCGLERTPLALRAQDALLRSQNDDGGWAGLRMQASTAEETAWAILGLLRCAPRAEIEAAVRRGTAWLAARPQSDGSWVPAPIGLYYSAMWYSDSSFALTLPIQALARAQRLYVQD